jgi:hypothetical protein
MTTSHYEQTFILPRALSRERVIERVAALLASLPIDKAWRLTIAEAKPKRSLSQNALLWAVYGEIIKKGGEAMAGWEPSELHDYFLMEHYGAETVEIFGKRKLRPLRRSSGMTKTEFSDHIEFILRFMADRGVYIETQSEAA